MTATSTRRRPPTARVLRVLALTATLALALGACASTPTPVTGLGAVGSTPTVAASAPAGDGNHSAAPSTPATTAPPSAPSTPTTPTTPSTPSTPTATPSPSAPVTVEDCVGYNPATVSIAADGSAYDIVDGAHAMLIVDNVADADAALALVRNYNRHCFIGRGNGRTGNDYYRYIVSYWKGTGVPGATVPTADCIAYDNTTVADHSIGADGWQVTSGSSALLVLTTQDQADAAVTLAGHYGHLCFIGRGNTRTPRNEYIVQYWTH